MSSLQRFRFESVDVRVVGDPDNPEWVAKDVCAALGLGGSVVRHLRRLSAAEKGVAQIDTPGGKQRMVTVNEPGLYRLIFRSEKPEARRFQDWLFHEVLPAIRRTGQYVAHDMVMVKRRAWEEHQQTVETLSEAYELQAAASTKLASLAASMLAQRRHSKPKDDPRQGLIRFEDAARERLEDEGGVA